MSSLITAKLILVSFCWVICWALYYTSNNIPPSNLRIANVLAPFIIAVLWFLLFFWG